MTRAEYRVAIVVDPAFGELAALAPETSRLDRLLGSSEVRLVQRRFCIRQVHGPAASKRASVSGSEEMYICMVTS